MRSKKNKKGGAGKNSNLSKLTNRNLPSKMSLKQLINNIHEAQGDTTFKKFPMFLLDKLFPDIRRLGNTLIKKGHQDSTYRTDKYYDSISLHIPKDISKIKSWFVNVMVPLGEGGTKRKLTNDDLYAVGV